MMLRGRKKNQKWSKRESSNNRSEENKTKQNKKRKRSEISSWVGVSVNCNERGLNSHCLKLQGSLTPMKKRLGPAEIKTIETTKKKPQR
jgi:hypothetical protein